MIWKDGELTLQTVDPRWGTLRLSGCGRRSLDEAKAFCCQIGLDLVVAGRDGRETDRTSYGVIEDFKRAREEMVVARDRAIFAVSR